jgi:hypothetical protein
MYICDVIYEDSQKVMFKLKVIPTGRYILTSCLNYLYDIHKNKAYVIYPYIYILASASQIEYLTWTLTRPAAPNEFAIVISDITKSLNDII